MIIKRLILHNFGIYAGDNTFTFSGNHPVVLIGGNNGRGKTTFLEAILLALYGSNSFLFRESEYRTYQQYLRSFVNLQDGTFETYIQLDFELEEEGKSSYTVKRSWKGNSFKTGEELSVIKNGQRENFLENNWLHFFEGVLPSGVAKFFFFDGEKIAELAKNNSSLEVKESIRALLGLSVLDQLGKDLDRITKSSERSIANSIQQEEYEEAKEKCEKAKVTILSLEQRASLLRDQISEIKEKIQTEQIQFVRKGGEISKIKKEKENQIQSLKYEVEKINADLMNLVSGALPLQMLKTQLAEIYRQAEHESQMMVQTQTVSEVKKMADEFKAVKPAEAESLKSFLSFIDEKYTGENATSVYSFSSRSLEQLRSLTQSELDQQRSKVQELREARQKAQKSIDENYQYLETETDEAAAQEISETITNLNIQLGELNGQLGEIERMMKEENSHLFSLERDYQKKSKAAVESNETITKNERLHKYSLMSQTVLDTYKTRLQIKRTKNLADIITQCYLTLSNKKKLIQKIEMDPITLDLTYLNENGETVDPGSLSAGEQQLMVISLLWALAKSSRRRLPVVVDTPLARLDSSHRRAIVSNYYPNASDQIIILSTDTEITSEYYEILKPYIDQEYSLVYDENQKATTVQPAFFTGGKS